MPKRKIWLALRKILFMCLYEAYDCFILNSHQRRNNEYPLLFMTGESKIHHPIQPNTHEGSH